MDTMKIFLNKIWERKESAIFVGNLLGLTKIET